MHPLVPIQSLVLETSHRCLKIMSSQRCLSPDTPPSNSSPSDAPAPCTLPVLASVTAREDPHTRIPPYIYPTVVNKGWDLYLQWVSQKSIAWWYHVWGLTLSGLPNLYSLANSAHGRSCTGYDWNMAYFEHPDDPRVLEFRLHAVWGYLSSSRVGEVVHCIWTLTEDLWAQCGKSLSFVNLKCQAHHYLPTGHQILHGDGGHATARSDLEGARTGSRELMFQ